MESGALSEPEFAEFAKDVVPFLHITTRIEGHPNDDLLSEKGFRAFPTLAFMDAEGNVLTQPTGRSVQSFRKTHKALKEYEEIKKRMEAGEEGLDFKLFVAEWELGKLDWEQAKQRVEALGELTAEQSAKAKKILILAEIEHLAGNARDEAGLEKAAKRFKEILAAGNAPTKGGLGSTAWNFWYVLLNWADTQEDAALFAKASKKVKKILGDEERYADFFQRLDDRLTELQEKDPAKP